jgi:hypothetical protein
MAKALVKIRGYQWAMTYRGFEIYYNQRTKHYLAKQGPHFGHGERAEYEGHWDHIQQSVDAYWDAAHTPTQSWRRNPYAFRPYTCPDCKALGDNCGKRH